MTNSVSKHIHLVCIAAEYRGIEDTTIPPSGCLYVGDALKKAGYSVTVHHLSSNQIGEATHIISTSKPLFVGFSVLTGSPVVHSARMSRLLKKTSPEIPVVWGGIHPSLMPESCLKEDSVDFVIRGEGEATVTEFAGILKNGGALENIAGLCWKDSDGNIRINPDRPFIKDLDQFHQDWSLIDPSNYVRRGLDGTRYISFITSRGCPHNCGFCYNLSFNRRRWRAHSVDFVVDEIRKLRQLTGINCITFNDDNFMVNESRAFQILEQLEAIHVRVSWLEVRLDRINDRILSKLSQYGVRTLFIGWESGSDRTLKMIDKGFDTSLILKNFKLAAKYSFDVDASAIVGFPFETEADWKKTIDMAQRIDKINPGRNKFNIGIYAPYPGTPIVKHALERGFRFPEDILSWGSFDILKGDMELPWITPSKVRRIARIDRYSKMLYTGGLRNPFVGSVRRFFAAIARLRLKTNVMFFPVEAFLYDQAVKFYLKRRIVSSKR